MEDACAPLVAFDSDDPQFARGVEIGMRVDRSTGEYHPRCEPDFETYVTGGGEPASGVRFVTLTTRLRAVNERIILDVIDAPAAGGEVAHAMEAFRRTLPLLPGSQVVPYDGAVRGVHRRELFAMGKIPASPVRNKDNDVPRQRHFGQVDVRWADGTATSEPAHLIDAALHLQVQADQDDKAETSDWRDVQRVRSPTSRWCPRSDAGASDQR